MARRYRAAPDAGTAGAQRSPLELGDLDPLVGGVRVARPAGAEVDGVEAARGEVGDVRPRLLRLELERAGRRSSCTSGDCAATCAGGECDVISASRRTARGSRASADVGRAVRRVAEVDVRLGPRRDHVRRDARVELRHRHHLAEHEPVDRRRRAARCSSTGAEPFERERDRVHAEPRPRRVRRAALEDDARVQVAEAAELERVVGRLEADDELRLVDDAGALEHAGQRVLGRAELLAREEEERRRRRRVSVVVRPARRARSSRRGRPSCRSRRARSPRRRRSARAGSPARGRCRCGPASSDERLARCACAKRSDSPSS